MDKTVTFTQYRAMLRTECNAVHCQQWIFGGTTYFQLQTAHLSAKKAESYNANQLKLITCNYHTKHTLYILYILQVKSRVVTLSHNVSFCVLLVFWMVLFCSSEIICVFAEVVNNNNFTLFHVFLLRFRFSTILLHPI